jgi:hypothetical protein
MSMQFDSEYEAALLDQTRRIQARYQGGGGIGDPMLAAGLAQSYPWLRPGVVTSLAQAGVSPDDPVAERAGAAGARVAGERREVASKSWSLFDALKLGTRAAFTVMSSLAQEAQAVFRGSVAARAKVSGGEARLFRSGDWAKEWVEYAPALREEVGKSVGALAIRHFLAGQETDLGDGWFPGGPIMEEHERLVRQLKVAGLPDDKPVSIGRILWYHVVEPDTTAFNMLSGLTDAALLFKLDPTVIGLRKLAAVREAARLADDPEKIQQWLQSSGGNSVVQRLVGETDFRQLHRALGKKVHPKVVRELQRADDEATVRKVLERELGGSIRHFPRAGRQPLQKAVGRPTIRKDGRAVRLGHMVPHERIDLEDAASAVEEFERLGITAGMPVGRLSKHMETIADAAGPMRSTPRQRPGELLTAFQSRLDDTTREMGQRLVARRAVFDFGEEISELLLQKQLGPRAKKKAQEISRLFATQSEQQRLYHVGSIADRSAVGGLFVGDELQRVTSPFLWAELTERFMPLPDPRAIRRLASRFPNFWTNPAIETGVAAADSFMSSIWKPMVLLRGAWTVRVVGEEQARMAGAGLDSMFRHPASAITWVTGRKGGVGVTGKPFRDTATLIDDMDEYSRALSRRMSSWRGSTRTRVVTKNHIPYHYGEDGFSHAWAEELIRFRSDPVVRQLVEAPADVKQWFWSGSGQRFRKEMEVALGDRGRSLGRQVGADAYIDELSQMVQKTTAGNGGLLEFLRTGKLDDLTAIKPHGDYKRLNQQFTKRLDALADSGVRPQVVVGQQYAMPRVPGGAMMDQLDRVTEVMFNTLMTRPTNYLSRSTAFKQFYWKRVGEMGKLMTPTARAKVAANARKANLDDVAVRLESMTDVGKLSLPEVDTIAKGFGLDSTRHLLYDLTERGQFMDIARHIFPFGEAWKEVLTRWARLGRDNPLVLRRFQQTVEGARGSGFFYTDESSGEEMFAYPGAHLLTRMLGLPPVNFLGRTSGLNIALNVIPGFGPIIGIAADKLLPDATAFDGLRNVLIPFGAPEVETGVIEAFLPPWFQKFRQAGITPFGRQDQRIYNNTVFDVARWLVATGKHKTDTPEAMDALLADAHKKANAVWMVRGALQYFAPSAPKPEFLVKDRQGQFMTYTAIVNDYQKMSEADWDTAPAKFLSKYGEQFFLFMQGKSRSLVPGVRTSKEAYDWARDNAEVTNKYRNVWGFFAPEGELFDYDAYRRHFEEGIRQALTPEQALRVGNHRVAAMIYQNASDRLGKSKTATERAWLRDLRAALIEDYPGFQDFSHLTQKATTETLIGELEKAAADPVLAQTETGRALAVWFQARDTALARAKAKGLAHFKTAQAAAPIRTWLRQVAQALTQEHPEFAEVYDELLSREVPDDA